MVSNESREQQAAQFLFQAHAAREPYHPIPEQFAPRTITEAYDVQDAYHGFITSSRGPIVGYKVALTTPVMQRMVGFNEPCAGAVFANGVHQSPASIRGAAYVHLGAECEVAVLLNRDMPAESAPYDRASAGEAVGALMPAFELVDDRSADYSDLFFLGVVADNTWNAGVVLGPQVTAWRNIDLAATRGAMIINGQRAGEGKGGDVMGHPLEALAWLANTLAARGKSLLQGMIVMTGSIVSTKFLNTGDTATVSIDGLGEARLAVT